MRLLRRAAHAQPHSACARRCWAAWQVRASSILVGPQVGSSRRSGAHNLLKQLRDHGGVSEPGRPSDREFVAGRRPHRACHWLATLARQAGVIAGLRARLHAGGAWTTVSAAVASHGGKKKPYDERVARHHTVAHDNPVAQLCDALRAPPCCMAGVCASAAPMACPQRGSSSGGARRSIQNAAQGVSICSSLALPCRISQRPPIARLRRPHLAMSGGDFH